MAKYDWDRLTIEFVAGDWSVKEFADLKKIPETTMIKAYRRYEWGKKRSENGRQVVGKSLEMVCDDRAEELAKQNQRDLEAVAVAHAVIVRQLASERLKPADVRALAGSLKDLQAVARLALGATTENTNTNINLDFEAWLNERNIDIEN